MASESESPQGNRTTKGNLGKIGKDASRVVLPESPRKQGVFEIESYSRLIVFTNIVFGDMSMSLEKGLENQGNRGAIALGVTPENKQTKLESPAGGLLYTLNTAQAQSLLKLPHAPAAEHVISTTWNYAYPSGKLTPE